MEKDKRLNFRVNLQEYEILSQYCKQTRRSQSDVLRELIRALEKRKPSSEGAPGHLDKLDVAPVEGRGDETH